MNTMKYHDLTKLQARGFELREESTRGFLTGASANLRLDGPLRIQIYQPCQELYELQGQGRGRPKKYVSVDEEWFSPSWYISKRENGEWVEVAAGSAETVDIAVDGALNRFRELFPTVTLPAGIL